MYKLLIPWEYFYSKCPAESFLNISTYIRVLTNQNGFVNTLHISPAAPALKEYNLTSSFFHPRVLFTSFLINS